MGLSRNPGNYYINAHTSASPGGAIRGQLMSTDQMSFQVPMTPDQEVPPVTGLDATAPSKITIFTSRNPDATVAAGLVVFDVNPRFPAGTQFTGLHIHEAPAGTSGTIVVDSMLQSEPILVGDDGFGNIYRVVSVAGTAGTGTLTSIVSTPWKFYENLHTTVHPGGAVRGQLSTGATQLPAVTSVETSVPYSTITTIAPGSQFVIRGTNLAAVATGLTGFNNLRSWPTSLNGTSVTIGGVAVPLSSVSGTEIRGQVPFNITPGRQPVVVTTATGVSRRSWRTWFPPLRPFCCSLRVWRLRAIPTAVRLRKTILRGRGMSSWCLPRDWGRRVHRSNREQSCRRMCCSVRILFRRASAD